MKPSVKEEAHHVGGLTLLDASTEQIYLIMSFLNPDMRGCAAEVVYLRAWLHLPEVTLQLRGWRPVPLRISLVVIRLRSTI